MKIAIFCPRVSGHGGMENAIRNLLSGFAQIGDEARLFLLASAHDKAWLEGLDFTDLGSMADPRWKRMIQYATGPVRALRWNPDVIICADLTTVVMARLGRALTGKFKVLISSWIHFPVAEMRMARELRHADLHLAIATESAEEIARYVPEHADRVYTIYNAIDVRGAGLIPRPQSPVFLYIGRLNYDLQKRVNDIFCALAKLRGDWRLRIIGSEDIYSEGHEARLHALAAELGIAGRIDWMGWQDKPWEAAGEITALVLASEREAFGMVLVEGCSHGIPFVSTACAGPLEIVKEGENGWIYPIGDVDALAARLQAIIDDPSILPEQDKVVGSVQQFSAAAVAQRAKGAVLAEMAKR